MEHLEPLTASDLQGLDRAIDDFNKLFNLPLAQEEAEGTPAEAPHRTPPPKDEAQTVADRTGPIRLLSRQG